MLKKFLFTVVLTMMVLSVSAAAWPYFGTARRISTLVICSNNKSPRLLADTIRALSKQPYLLVPAKGSQDNKIYFLPAKSTAREIRLDDVASFVKYMNPMRIVVLGGEDVVSPEYTNRLFRNIPIFRVECSDWLKMADQLEYMLNVSGLSREYRELRTKMFEDNYRQTSLPPVQQPEDNADKNAEESAAASETAETAASASAD